VLGLVLKQHLKTSMLKPGASRRPTQAKALSMRFTQSILLSNIQTFLVVQKEGPP
jgi:hypothetical protein